MITTSAESCMVRRFRVRLSIYGTEWALAPFDIAMLTSTRLEEPLALIGAC